MSNIEEKYTLGVNRLTTETYRITLPVFLDVFDRGEYIRFQNMQFKDNWVPIWNKKTQSRLIESLIINVPILPIILYEKKYKILYEIIDGNERLNTFKQFDNDQLILSGLQVYPELNGRTFSMLPQKIKLAIYKRRLSFTVFLPMNKKCGEQEEINTLLNVIKERL